MLGVTRPILCLGVLTNHDWSIGGIPRHQCITFKNDVHAIASTARRACATHAVAAPRRAMGIKGLPAVVEPWCASTHVERYANTRAAVDAYSWLHKGCYSAAQDIATGNAWWRARGQDAPYVTYCLFRANLLRHHGITPVIVFDGDRLPAKRREEEERRARRQAQISRAHEAKSVNDSHGAKNAFAAGMDVTPAMAHELIVALRRQGFEFIVAPYEADGQIAALAATPSSEGGVDLVFTEDSDLVAYGCETVIFKLEKSGDAKEFKWRNMLAGPPPAREENDENFDDVQRKKGPPPLDFRGWDFELFLSLCVLSGCDFLDNIRGLGIKKMYALLNKCKNTDAAFKLLRADKKIEIPDGYEEEWRKARLIFKHALVYDMRLKTLRHLTPIPADIGVEDLSFLGPKYDDAEATSIATGDTDPITRKPFIAPVTNSTNNGASSLFSNKEMKFAGKKRKQEKALGPAATSAQKSLMMNFFTKVAKVVKSPIKSMTRGAVPAAPVPVSKNPPKSPALGLLSDDDDDFMAVSLDALAPAKPSTPSASTIEEINLLDDDVPDALASSGAVNPTSAFARAPPRAPRVLASLFSPQARARPQPPP